MDLFQLNIYTNPLAYPFIIRSIKTFLNNNNLHIKQEHNLSINSYPKIYLEKQILFESAYKKNEVEKICSRLPDFLNQYNKFHPSNLDLDIDLIDLKSQKEFQKNNHLKIKQIKWILVTLILSFGLGLFLSKLEIRKTLTFNQQNLELISANTDLERQIGLSKYKVLPHNSAMLFNFQDQTTQAFWMKNMHFPIDIIFLDENNQVVDIHPNQPPCPLKGECQLIEAKQPYYKVIETKANFSLENNLQIQDQIQIHNTIKFID